MEKCSHCSVYDSNADLFNHYQGFTGIKYLLSGLSVG